MPKSRITPEWIAKHRDRIIENVNKFGEKPTPLMIDLAELARVECGYSPTTPHGNIIFAIHSQALK